MVGKEFLVSSLYDFFVASTMTLVFLWDGAKVNNIDMEIRDKIFDQKRKCSLMRQHCDDNCFYKKIDKDNLNTTLSDENLVILYQKEIKENKNSENESPRSSLVWEDLHTKKQYSNLENFCNINDEVKNKIDEYEASVDQAITQIEHKNETEALSFFGSKMNTEYVT